MEKYCNSQYIVRVDGSGRVTLRNRKFLRRFVPMKPQRIPVQIGNDIPSHSPSPFATQFAPHRMADSSSHPSPPLSIPSASTGEPPAPIQPPLTSATNSRSSDSEVLPTPVPPAVPSSPQEQDDSDQPDAVPPPLPLRQNKKAPLALRRLASYNTEGQKGLREYNPERDSDS